MKSSSFCFFLGAAFVTFGLSFSQSAFAFGPCSNTMPEGVSYLPSVKQCDGKAAIVLSGAFINSFSAVLRACDNGDRDPCYKNLNSCGTNFSSPFKVQKVVPANIRRLNGKIAKANIHCLKEAGNSQVYRMVRRLTIKRVDPVKNPATDVFKICLPSRVSARNAVEIIAAGNPRGVGNTGFNQACLTQKYLGCNIDQAIQSTCSF